MDALTVTPKYSLLHNNSNCRSFGTYISEHEITPSNITLRDIHAEAKLLLTKSNELVVEHDILVVKTANDWIKQAKARPIPKMLFGEFWLEGELCFLFADTNVGKSILAVQIADSISNGIAIPGVNLEAEKQIVLYYDFELSDKQFEKRYSIDYCSHYQWGPNFYRIEINPGFELPEGRSFEDCLSESMSKVIVEKSAKILIIDNLTYLRTETEKAKDALPLMKELIALKNKFGLSILALTHTPKRDFSKPISKNDLQGSKMLINLCDSAFSIGESFSDSNLRYLKQIKARSTEILYDADNVYVCQIEKPDNFLKFEFLSYGREKDHLKQLSEKESNALIDNVIELKNSGQSFRSIGMQLGISHTKAKRIFDKCNKS